MKLLIDSSVHESLTLILTTEQGEARNVIDIRDRRSQHILTALDAFLAEQQTTLTKITAISVVTGPGSFTGLRVGATIAVMLSALLNVPINDQPPATIPKLTYGENKWNI